MAVISSGEIYVMHGKRRRLKMTQLLIDIYLSSKHSIPLFFVYSDQSFGVFLALIDGYFFSTGWCAELQPVFRYTISI